MADYQAPLRDIRFVLRELAGIDQVAQLPGYEEASVDVIEAILDEAAKFATGVLAPLNRSGDREGIRWQNNSVSMPVGFREAYMQFTTAGWMGLSCSAEFGGQGLPKLLSVVVQEMWKAANVSFSLCQMLTLGAIEALMLRGSAAQKALYLSKLVSGTWTGTMNLTEPQAGSDLAAIRSRAVLQGDGTYRIFGQKIFITYGDHDMAENIVHLVLARTPDAPSGIKGISLFVVPKFLTNADGSLGVRNDAYCVSVEHKLGIHACPTCVMVFGNAGEGAFGTLVGEENAGLTYMFIMMNAARFAIGLEGLGLAERAFQQARAYARERVQGRDVYSDEGSVPIIRHPDVRRMLMLMKSQIEAMRALAYVVAAAQDVVSHHPDADERRRRQAFVDLMIPIVKGWLTETANEIAYIGVQVHGGMGFIEETGAAQYMRDARITTIYEGTTGIQAQDLIGRKVARDGGTAIRALFAEMRTCEVALRAASADDIFSAIAAALDQGITAAERAVDYIVSEYAGNVRAAAAGSVPFLRLMGIVCGGWQMGRATLAAQVRINGGDTDPFLAAKIVTTRFYADHVLSAAPGLAHTVIHGGAGVLGLGEEQF